MAELLLGKPIFPGLPLSTHILFRLVRCTFLKQTFGCHASELESYLCDTVEAAAKARALLLMALVSSS